MQSQQSSPVQNASHVSVPSVMPPVSSSALATFAAQVTAHREDRGWSKAELATQANLSSSYVSHVENLTKPPTPLFAEGCDRAFRLPATFVALYKLLELGEQDSAAVADVEADAIGLVDWSTWYVPGLLQTEDYARAAMATVMPPDTVDRELKIRLGRQGILGKLVTGWFIVSESALRHDYGGQEVMHRQLLHLAAVAAWPNIGLQVMPDDTTGHPGGEGPLRVVEYPDKAAVWFTEGRNAGRMSTDRTGVMRAQHELSQIKSAALSVPASIALIQRVRESGTSNEH